MHQIFDKPTRKASNRKLSVAHGVGAAASPDKETSVPSFRNKHFCGQNKVLQGKHRRREEAKKAMKENGVTRLDKFEADVGAADRELPDASRTRSSRCLLACLLSDLENSSSEFRDAPFQT